MSLLHDVRAVCTCSDEATDVLNKNIAIVFTIKFNIFTITPIFFINKKPPPVR